MVDNICISFVEDSREFVFVRKDQILKVKVNQDTLDCKVDPNPGCNCGKIIQNLLLLGFISGQIKVFNLESLTFSRNFKAHLFQVEGIEYCLDSKTFASYDQIVDIKLWSLDSFNLVAQFNNITFPVKCLALSKSQIFFGTYSSGIIYLPIKNKEIDKKSKNKKRNRENADVLELEKVDIFSELEKTSNSDLPETFNVKNSFRKLRIESFDLEFLTISLKLEQIAYYNVELVLVCLKSGISIFRKNLSKTISYLAFVNLLLVYGLEDGSIYLLDTVNFKIRRKFKFEKIPIKLFKVSKSWDNFAYSVQNKFVIFDYKRNKCLYNCNINISSGEFIGNEKFFLIQKNDNFGFIIMDFKKYPVLVDFDFRITSQIIINPLADSIILKKSDSTLILIEIDENGKFSYKSLIKNPQDNRSYVISQRSFILSSLKYADILIS